MKRVSLLLLVSACTTAAPKPTLPPGTQADGTFLRLSAEAAIAADPAAVAAALQTECEGTCDRLYIDVDDALGATQLMALVDAATRVTPPPRVFVNTAEGPIELAVEDPGCEVTVTVLPTGATVRRGSDLLAPDPTCEQWRATICRGDDESYDWPRLRSEVGTPRAACVAFTDTVAEIGAIGATLRKPLIRVVPAQANDSAISTDELAAVVAKYASALQWCFEGEVLEKPVPMSLTLRVAVFTDGTITRAEVVDGVRTTSQFEECVRAEGLKFVFAAQPVSTVVDLPLEFDPASDAPQLVTQ